jgi:hypothetical protein
MKRLFQIFLLLLTGLVLCNSSKSTQKEIDSVSEDQRSSVQESVSVKKETAIIKYRKYSNSGKAIATEYVIYNDSLVWKYTEYRNNFRLQDVVKYNREEFDKLIDNLSRYTFSIERTEPVCGGGGESFSFSTEAGCYLTFDDSNCELYGDADEVKKLIRQFVHLHPTSGKKDFKRLSK